MSTLRFSVRRLLLAAIAGPLAFSTAARGQATVTWSGGNSTWSQPDTDSFNSPYASGDTAVFAGAGQGTVTIGSGVTPGQVNVTNGSYTFSGGLGGSTATSGLTKTGTGTLTLSGVANTYQGTTTVSGGTLVLSKGNNVIAVPGNLVIEDAVVRFGIGNNFNNQIASTAAVTMSGSTAGFNGIGFADFNLSNFELSQTLASFTVTGGVVNTNNASSATGLTITGAGSITGGAGNTDFWYGSGGLGSFGSLSLVGMTGTALNPGAAAPNSFRLFGNNATRQTQVTIGSGGLSLDGSNILLALGAEAGRLGSRIVLNGNVTTSGSSASSIMPPSGDSGSFGTRQVALSSTAGSVTRTFTTGGGGADLTVSVAITNGSATTAGLTKAGAGTLTLSAANTYNGSTTVSEGRLLVSGTLGNTAVSVSSAARLGGTGSLGGTLSFATDSFLEVVDFSDPLAVTGSTSFGTGFGVTNLAGIDWGSLDLDTSYNILSTTQQFSAANITNFGFDNRVGVDGGREAYFTSLSSGLQVVVVPEPGAVLVAGLGLAAAAAAALLRRRRLQAA